MEGWREGREGGKEGERSTRTREGVMNRRQGEGRSHIICKHVLA